MIGAMATSFGSGTTFYIDGAALRVKLQVAIDRERPLAAEEKRHQEEAVTEYKEHVKAQIAKNEARFKAYQSALAEWQARPFWSLGRMPVQPYGVHVEVYSQYPVLYLHHATRLEHFEKALAAIEPTLWYTMTLAEAMEMGWGRPAAAQGGEGKP